MIEEIAKKFTGTKIYEALTAVDILYRQIERAQKTWKEKAPTRCPKGCGSCCAHFEPEVYEYEALYLAAWMLDQQKERAEYICTHSAASLTERDGCFLFAPDTPYHCTVYDGRCLICRLFGFSGDTGKDSHIRWKPCKHMESIDKEMTDNTGHQYSEQEMQEQFGATPPDMYSSASRLLALNPEDTRPRPLRVALPAAIQKLKLLLQFLTPPEPDCPSPHPLSA